LIDYRDLTAATSPLLIMLKLQQNDMTNR